MSKNLETFLQWNHLQITQTGAGYGKRWVHRCSPASVCRYCCSCSYCHSSGSRCTTPFLISYNTLSNRCTYKKQRSWAELWWISLTLGLLEAWSHRGNCASCSYKCVSRWAFLEANALPAQAGDTLNEAAVIYSGSRNAHGASTRVKCKDVQVF